MQSNLDLNLSAIYTHALFVKEEPDVDSATTFCLPETKPEHDGKTLEHPNLRTALPGLLGIIRGLQAYFSNH
ncbi:MAG: hypothetical protein IT308_06775 [Anaerolineaceae bacterium]|nr:hypothetical protein [Anaerolineaceae bacterium]